MVDNIEWSNLGFAYMKTPYNIRCRYIGGKWGELEIHSEDTITMNIGATCLHYGQEAFEGLKAFRCKDGKVRIFRMEENAKRLLSSAQYLKMAEPSVEMFCEAVVKAVQLNEEYIPPFDSGASLYIRPLLIGLGAQVGVKPASEYEFIVFVTPVGPYFKKEGATMKAVIDRKHDRAAPHGTGHVKVGGNYAASLTPAEIGHEQGYDSVFYLDPKENKYIDECGAANFFGIKDGKYITPASSSVLPSITNKSLCTLAEDMGLAVERRHIPVEELATFEEAGACGTAAVITPISTIHDADNNKVYDYGEKPGPWSMKLYKRLLAIQHGEEPDKFGWVTVL